MGVFMLHLVFIFEVTAIILQLSLVKSKVPGIEENCGDQPQ